MKEIKRYLDTRIGQYSFYFEDLDSGYTYGWEEDTQKPSASCIKVPIVMSFLKEVEEKKFSLEDKVFISKEDMVDGSGFIYELDEREYTLRELITAMLILSDNTATNKLIDMLGKDNINQRIKDMGLLNTFLYRKIRDAKLREKGVQNLSSSSDLAKCFKLLYRNEYLNKEHSEFLINTLKRQQIRNKIPFYIPKKEWSNIGNKAGSLPGVENDMALMNISKGNFVFTIMSQGLPNNVYGLVTVSRVSKMMWDIIQDNMD